MFATIAWAAAVSSASTSGSWPQRVSTNWNRPKAHGYSLVSEPRTTDARSSRLASFRGDGWLAAGDAAATFDPLSAQGIYFALYSGVAVGKALAAGDGAALERYEAAIARVYEAFLLNRRVYYGQERRWPSSPFWCQRRGGPVQRATSKP